MFKTKDYNFEIIKIHKINGLVVLIKIFIAILLLNIFGVCADKTYRKLYPALSDGLYDSEFPYRSASEDIEKMCSSIRKVHTNADYILYFFNKESKITKKKIEMGGWESKSIHTTSFNKSVSGSGTILVSNENQIVILTCAHVVSFPDSLISYHEKKGIEDSLFIRSIAIKVRERSFVRDIPEGGLVEIIAIDKELDIAFVGKKTLSKAVLNEIHIKRGISKQLNWGNFVYIIGYPLGNQMITKAIVSKSNRVDDSFLIDAMFNRGFSGGLVIAIRDGVPNFEWVGIAKSVASKSEYILKPEKDYFEYAYNPEEPYHGETYVQLKEEINYGITFVIPSDKIAEFYWKNRSIITNKGYFIESLEKLD